MPKLQGKYNRIDNQEHYFIMITKIKF